MKIKNWFVPIVKECKEFRKSVALNSLAQIGAPQSATLCTRGREILPNSRPSTKIPLLQTPHRSRKPPQKPGPGGGGWNPTSLEDMGKQGKKQRNQQQQRRGKSSHNYYAEDDDQELGYPVSSPNPRQGDDETDEDGDEIDAGNDREEQSSNGSGHGDDFPSKFSLYQQSVQVVNLPPMRFNFLAL